MGDFYALTITLKPKLYSYDARRQYDESYLHVLDILDDLYEKYTVTAEVTKSASNIHYHCVIQGLKYPVRNPRLQLHNKIRRDNIIGFICMKHIDNLNMWLEYMYKDVEKTREDIGRPSIIIDKLNYTPNEFRKEFVLRVE